MSFMGISMDNVILYQKLQRDIQDINVQNLNEHKEQIHNEVIPVNSLQSDISKISKTSEISTKPVNTKQEEIQKKNPSVQIVEHKLKSLVQKKLRTNQPPIKKFTRMYNRANIETNVKLPIKKLKKLKTNITSRNVGSRNITSKNSKKIKLPFSKYISNDGVEIISLNNGNYLIMGNMCFVYRNTVNNYYNSKLSLEVLSIENNINYTLHTSKDEYIEIRHKSDVLNIHESLMLLTKCKMLNHPVRLEFHEEALFSNDLSILCNFNDNNLVLDFSDSVSYECWDEIYSRLSHDFEITNNYKIYIPIEKLKLDQWKISIQDDLIQLSFEIDNKVLLSGSMFNGMFDEIEGFSDMSLRSNNYL